MYKAWATSLKVVGKRFAHQSVECLLQHLESLEAFQVVVRIGGANVVLHRWCFEVMSDELFHDGSREGWTHSEQQLTYLDCLLSPEVLKISIHFAKLSI